MATRSKTVWYAAQLVADVVDNTLTSLGTITVYTENSSRVFKSCLVWTHFEDIVTATGGTITQHACSVSVNAATATTTSETDDIANTGENISGVLGPWDFTSHFTTNYPAADASSVAISVLWDQSTGTTLNMRNCSALLCITYEYDDTAATQYQTAIIPLESTTGVLATTETEIGTNQIPQLTGTGGYLENVAGVIVRQQFFVIESNDESNASVTDYTLNVRIDTGTTHTYGVTGKALGSDCFKRRIHIEAPATTAVHAFKMWTTGLASCGPHAVCMYVSYQFTVSGTTSFLNSVQIPFQMNASPMQGTASTTADRISLDLYVEEPTTITLRQSAYKLTWVSGNGAQVSVLTRAGAQAFRTYTGNASVVCGGECLQQRVDSGSAQGAGMTLARGKNTITIDLYRTDTSDLGWIPTGIVYLNYTSGVSSQGIGAHKQTRVHLLAPWDGLVVVQRTVSAPALSIPEANVWIDAIGSILFLWVAGGPDSFTVLAQVNSGEAQGDGWRTLDTAQLVKDAEIGVYFYHLNASAHFLRYTGDSDATRLPIEVAREYQISGTGIKAIGAVIYLTYHAITFTVGGDITGSAGGTVNIEAHRSDTDEKIGSTSRVGNGAYTIPWYDNTIACYTQAREDGTHIGRSNDLTPTGSA
jgi:hypothetical protein